MWQFAVKTKGIVIPYRNQQLMDEESTKGIVILPGFSRSGTMNPSEEGFFAENYQLMVPQSWTLI
jgi:hypothetical protein